MDLETCRLLPAAEAPGSLPPLEGSHPEKEQGTEAKEARREGPVAREGLDVGQRKQRPVACVGEPSRP